MERVIELLNEKNHYLEKFYSLNESELDRFVRGNFETLDYFYNSREKILEIIRYIDSQINEISPAIEQIKQKLTADMKKEVNDCLYIKDQYVEKILEQDLQVLACIESAKNEIIKELQDLKKSKKAVAGYKTPTFKNHLNEEA